MADPIQVTEEDLDNAALTLIGECRGEPLEGQQAVAWVIRTRATWQPPAWWGHNVSDVCLKPEQFSCWDSRDPNLAVIKATSYDSPLFLAMREIARSVFAGEVENPVRLLDGMPADHYEVVGTGASWARNKMISQIIGRHAFYAIGPH